MKCIQVQPKIIIIIIRAEQWQEETADMSQLAYKHFRILQLFS